MHRRCGAWRSRGCPLDTARQTRKAQGAGGTAERWRRHRRRRRQSAHPRPGWPHLGVRHRNIGHSGVNFCPGSGSCSAQAVQRRVNGNDEAVRPREPRSGTQAATINTHLLRGRLGFVGRRRHPARGRCERCGCGVGRSARSAAMHCSRGSQCVQETVGQEIEHKWRVESGRPIFTAAVGHPSPGQPNQSCAVPELLYLHQRRRRGSRVARGLCRLPEWRASTSRTGMRL